jgi:hypothetical protein
VSQFTSITRRIAAGLVALVAVVGLSIVSAQPASAVTMVGSTSCANVVGGTNSYSVQYDRSAVGNVRVDYVRAASVNPTATFTTGPWSRTVVANNAWVAVTGLPYASSRSIRVSDPSCRVTPAPINIT